MHPQTFYFIDKMFNIMKDLEDKGQNPEYALDKRYTKRVYEYAEKHTENNL